jgi:hypothetical protein
MIGRGRAGLLPATGYRAVLAVKDEGEDALAAFGGLRSLTAARAAISPERAIPPKTISEISIMNTSVDLSFQSHANAFDRGLSLEAVRSQAPAVFAPHAHERMSSKYTFIPTERVLTGLMNAGFVPVDARQTHTHRASPLHARHMVRLRRRFETVQLKGSVPEVVFLNSHDGTSAYQLRMGIYRVVCTNGLIVSRGAFPAYYVSHRGNVVDEVIAGALKVSEEFELLAKQVERMEQRRLLKDEQLQFAERALALRYPGPATSGMQSAQLLTCRRAEDSADDLWTLTNRVQENLLRGGLSRRSTSGRLTRTRRITSIKEDVRLNSGVWDLAMQVLAA